MQTLSFKCQNCHAGIRIKYQSVDRIPQKVKCPSCKQLTAVNRNGDTPSPANSDDDTEDVTVISGGNTHRITDKNPDAVLAWLILFEGNQTKTGFALKMGTYRIGRFHPNTAHEVDIAIRTEDMRMSKKHFDLQIKVNLHGRVECLLNDSNSKNGVYVNGRRDRKVSENFTPLLLDGYTLQAGRTRLVFKLNTPGRLSDAIKQVQQMTPPPIILPETQT
jgi:predicted Zn finger-like uncharacterized protein